MALFAGISGFLYSVAFIVLQSNLLSALFLLLGGLFSSAALTALYQRLRGAESGFALLGLLLALSAALGSAIHGGYDLSNIKCAPNFGKTLLTYMLHAIMHIKSLEEIFDTADIV